MARPLVEVIRCLKPPVAVVSAALLTLALVATAPSQAQPPQIQINSDATTELQNEEQIVINPTDPNNVVACWRDFRLGYRQVGVGYSFDGGFTWTDFLIGGELPWDSDPVLTVHSDGTFYLAVINTRASAESQISVHRSITGGVSWEGPFTAVFSACEPFNDKEWIAVDRSGGPQDGHVYVSWVAIGPGSKIMCVTSIDRAETWTSPVEVSDPGASVQWPVPIVLQNGDLLIAWVDLGITDEISYDISSDGGASWGVDQTLTATTTQGFSTINGGILVFPYPSLALDETGGPRAGHVYCVYGDEAVAGNGMDIWCRRSTNDGSSWGDPVRVNNDPGGLDRDQFHPWVVCDEAGVLHATWYDRRDDPANYLWHIYYSSSLDGGATWTPSRRITDVPSTPANLVPSPAPSPCQSVAGEPKGSPDWASPPATALGPLALRAGLLGEYSGVAARGGIVHPVWTDTRNGHQDVFTSVVPPNEDPDCSMAAADPAELWPPKHNFRSVSIVGVTDPDGDPVTITIDGVTQDEPLDSPGPGPGELLHGDGHTCPDARIVDGQLELRAERAGNRHVPGNGRVYEVSFTASDGNGGSCSGTASVCVPHDFRPGHQCVDDGQVVNSLGPCGALNQFDGSSTEISAVRFEAAAVIDDDAAIIEYELLEDGEVELAVFNVAGRRVALLENSLRVRGTHQVTWDTSSLPRGVYYCRIQAVGVSLSKALLLVN